MEAQRDPALSFINQCIQAKYSRTTAEMDWEELVAYFDVKTPGWREAYRREFGREPTPAGVAELIARESGGPETIAASSSNAPSLFTSHADLAEGFAKGPAGGWSGG